MTDYYIPWGGNLPRLFIDRNGDVMGGATLSAYKARTTTPINMYDGINGDVIGDEVTVSDGDNAGYIERDEVQLTSADTVVDVTADAPTGVFEGEAIGTDDFSGLADAAWVIDSTMPPDSGEGNDGDYATDDGLAANQDQTFNIYQKSGGSWSVVGQKDGTTGAVPANLGHEIDGYDQLFEKTFWGVASGQIRLYKDDWTNNSRFQGLSPVDVTHSNRAEVLTKVQAGNDWNDDPSVGVFLAGSGDSHADARGYFALLKLSAAFNNTRIELRRIGDSGSTLGNEAVDSDDYANLRWLRFRMDPDVAGIRLRAKAWLTTVSEPASWQIDTVDTDPLSLPGRLGMASWRRNRNIDRWDYFAYNVLGDEISLP